MNIFVDDLQNVPEVEDTLFELIQQGPVAASLIIKNQGINTINYRFQYFNGTTWIDMDDLGTDYYNTLVSSQSRVLVLESSYTKVRLVGNASGTSILSFCVTRSANRTSGGPLPILSF